MKTHLKKVVGILVICIFALMLNAFSCNKGTSPTFDWKKNGLPFEVGANYANGQTTPNGNTVASNEIVPDVALTEIDIGIDGACRSYKLVKPSWNCSKNGHLIYVLPKHTTNADGSPAFIVQGIQSAGTVLGVTGQNYPLGVAIPSQSSNNWDKPIYLIRSLWHETEHEIEFTNDLPTFISFAVSGDRHPHVPYDAFPEFYTRSS
jgi:hypothetical protein